MTRDIILAALFGLIINVVILGAFCTLTPCDYLNASGKALHFSITGERCK